MANGNDTKAVRPKVYTVADAAADPSVRPDGFMQKVVKYIPTEIVAAYVAVANILQPTEAALKTAGADPGLVAKLYTPLWVVFGVLLVLTPIYTWLFAQEPNKPKPIYQSIVAPIAFTAWVFAIGGPFTALKGMKELPSGIGSVVLILVLLIIPIAERVFAQKPAGQ